MSLTPSHEQLVIPSKVKSSEKDEMSSQRKEQNENPGESKKINSLNSIKRMQSYLMARKERSKSSVNSELMLIKSRKTVIDLLTVETEGSSRDNTCDLTSPSAYLLNSNEATTPIDAKQATESASKDKIQMLLKQIREAKKTVVEASASKELDLPVDVVGKFAKSSSSITEFAVEPVDLKSHESGKLSEKQTVDESAANASNLNEPERIASAIAYQPRNDGTHYAFDVEVEPRHRIRPANILGMNGVFVGNISPRQTEETLHDYFKPFGNVTNIFINPNRYSAFVHYSLPTPPVAAMFEYHALNVPGLSNGDRRLVLRFVPGNGQTYRDYNRNRGRKWTSRECYYWRTTGCDIAIRQCHQIHHPMCRGIDFQAWMISDIRF
ncbi:hypothetical protein HDE_09434 [Halotydeus destructor]|nr:hypothetical protein HDE_09434 [Halotydeus destructor]